MVRGLPPFHLTSSYAPVRNINTFGVADVSYYVLFVILHYHWITVILSPYRTLSFYLVSLSNMYMFTVLDFAGMQVACALCRSSSPIRIYTKY